MSASGTVETVDFVVRCIDPRCNRYLSERFEDAVWHTCLGASLAIHQSPHEFLERLNKVRKLGMTVSKVILVDHLDCRAYRDWRREEYAADATLWHRFCLTSVAQELQWRKPTLTVESYILDLNSGQLNPCLPALRESA